MGNEKIPFVILALDRERRWQLDVPAFEHACDGFDEVGMPEFVDNPIESLKEIGLRDDGQSIRLNRRLTKILRVWIWAGLTTDDPELKLADLAKQLTLARLPQFVSLILPPLSESLTGNPSPATAENDGDAAADIGHLPVLH